MNDFENIISNIRSIGYFLASKKDNSKNERLKNENKNVVSDITDIKLSDLRHNLDKLQNYYFQMEKQEKQPILRIKICVASSSFLAEERKAIESYLFWKNDDLIQQGIYLHYNVWEKQSARFNHTYKQEDYNEVLVYDSEIFICLIGDKVGKFTKEEFEKAKKRFDDGEKPYIFYVFFKNYTGNNTTPEWGDVIQLRSSIQTNYKQNFGEYNNAEGLILNILSFIDQDIEIVKQKLSEKS